MADFTLFLDTANSVLVLLTGLVGLIGTGVGAFFAIKNQQKKFDGYPVS